MKNHTCITWAAVGCLLGVSIVAYAQDPVVPVEPSNALWVTELVGNGGLPAVLAWLGYQLGRSGGIPVRLTVRMEEDD